MTDVTMLTQSYERDPVTGVRRLTVRALSDPQTVVRTDVFETEPRYVGPSGADLTRPVSATDLATITRRYRCPKCDGFYGVPNPRYGCAVFHTSDECCHYGEIQLEAPPLKDEAFRYWWPWSEAWR